MSAPLPLPPGAEAVLRTGTFCVVAARAGRRIHLTPVVFVHDGGRLWLTTSRSSIKARAWREDGRTAGLVGSRGRAVAFRGRVELFDLLDPSTWGESARRSPVITRAAARFTLKNARFFAGYARDAHRVPLSWTPPARVFASIELEAAALLDADAGTVLDARGEWPGRPPSDTASPAAPGRDLMAGLPDDVAEAVDRQGRGVVALGRTVLPAGWTARPRGFDLEMAPAHLELAGPDPSGPASVTAQRPSAWRAREMRGFMAQGFAAERARGLRLVPERLVWWSGWTTGTVAR